MRPKASSTAPPIIYGVLLVLVTLVLTVLYNMALVTDWYRARAGFWNQTLMLAVGWGMGLAVIVGLILFIVSLARQIRLNQRQQNFIDSVTHELKSPLTSLKLHLQTMRRAQLSPEQLAGFTEIMLADVERLDGLIDHVLEAARAESARRRPDQFEPISLRGRAELAIEAVRRRHQLPAEAIALVGEDATVRTDPVALDLVLSNLLENAVKYSRDEVRVTVRLAATPAGATLAVADTGVGIPRNQIRRIFHRFYRVGNEMTRIRQGTGLGLYIVAETVRQLKGTIRAQSPGENQGSVFTLTLPTTEPARQGDVPPPVGPPDFPPREEG